MAAALSAGKPCQKAYGMPSGPGAESFVFKSTPPILDILVEETVPLWVPRSKLLRPEGSSGHHRLVNINVGSTWLTIWEQNRASV